MKAINPKGPDKSFRQRGHVLRGGSCYNGADDLVVSYRYYLSPGYRGVNLGFRVACNGWKE